MYILELTAVLLLLEGIALSRVFLMYELPVFLISAGLTIGLLHCSCGAFFDVCDVVYPITVLGIFYKFYHIQQGWM